MFEIYGNKGFPMRVSLLIIFSAILLVAFARKGGWTSLGGPKYRGGSKSSGRVGSRGSSKYRGGSGYRGSRIFSRGNAVYASRIPYLFPMASSLAAIYIASSMRPSIHLRSYRDLNHYTVCTGKPTFSSGPINNGNIYTHYLCPDDPNRRSAIYCCRNEVHNRTGCCTSSELPSQTSDNLLIVLVTIFLSGLLLLILFCVCRKCRKSSQTRSTERSQPHQLVATTKEDEPYPSSNCPYPVNPSSVTFQNQSVPESDITVSQGMGPAWTSAANPDFPPPPPYSSLPPSSQSPPEYPLKPIM